MMIFLIVLVWILAVVALIWTAAIAIVVRNIVVAISHRDSKADEPTATQTTPVTNVAGIPVGAYYAAQTHMNSNTF